MEAQDWLEDVAGQLRSSGTSVAYQRRLLDELRDHIEDLCCEERNYAMSAQTVGNDALRSRLGTPQEVAAATKANVTRGRFARQHPLLMFLVLPIPTLILLWVAYTLALVGLIQLFREYRDVDWVVQLGGVLVHSLAYVPAITLVMLISWVATRSRAKVAWWLGSSILVAFVSCLIVVSFTVPTTPGTGSLSVGMGFPPALAHWPQFFVPLALTVAMIGYSVYRKRLAAPNPEA